MLVTAGVIEMEGKILIAKRSKDDPLKDKWEFPGGKLEPGETPEECLKRELEEELGVVTEIGELICSSKYEYSHVAIDLIVYRARYVSGEFNANDHAELKWVLPAELDHYDFPEADLPVIEELMKADAKNASENIRVVEIKEEPAELYKILKFENMVNSGGEAKHVIAEGLVRLNGEVETRKRKKIYSGDMIEFQEEKMRILLTLGE